MAGAALQLQQPQLWALPVYIGLFALGLALLLRRSRSCRGGWRHSQRTGGHDTPTPPSANLG